MNTGIVRIKATFNNTHVTISDKSEKLLCWQTPALVGYKKATAYGAQMAAKKAAEIAFDRGIREVAVEVNGFGPGREVAIQGLRGGGLLLTSLIDVTPIPHNGCRPPKKRRL